MREIKFRAWIKDMMWYPDKLSPFHKIAAPYILKLDPQSIDDKSSIMDEIGFTLMQYTGLKDKNGVEIYEGDVVEWEDRTADDMYGGDVIYPNEAVEFKGAAFYPVSMMPGEEFEVIGNIYENGDLLT